MEYIVFVIIVIFLVTRAVTMGSKPTDRPGTTGKAGAARTTGSRFVQSAGKGFQEFADALSDFVGEDAAKPQQEAPVRPASELSLAEREQRRKELLAKRAARRQAARSQAAARSAQPQVAQPQVAQPQVAAAEGDSMMLFGGVDDEGCVGGSMEHEHTEGESRAEHGEHIAAMFEREAREHEEAASVRESVLGDMDPATMRRAVIISEVLGRPKALKR